MKEIKLWRYGCYGTVLGDI